MRNVIAAFISGIALGISVATILLTNKHQKTIELYESVISGQPKYKPISAIYFNQNTGNLMVVIDSGQHRSISKIYPKDVFYKASK